MRDAREALRDRLALAELLENPVNDGLERCEHILLRDEAHLDIELVELTGQAVGARVLVAKAGCDLEVAIEAGHHQELLILLRRLREGVELARMDAGGNEVVARALRAGSRQDRRLEFEETGGFHAPADGIDDRAAFHDVAVQFLAPQIEKAVFQADLLGIFGLAEHRKAAIRRQGRAPRFRSRTPRLRLWADLD